MGRVEAAIFASPSPVTREALAKLVGRDCNLDDLLADIRDDLHARPYEFVHVAGGYQLRTKARYADALRVLNTGARDAGPPELTPTELLTVTAVAICSRRRAPNCRNSAAGKSAATSSAG